MFSLHLSDPEVFKSLFKELVLEVLEEIKNVDSSNEKLNNQTVINQDQFLTRKEVCQMLNVTTVTLDNWRKKEILIPLKIGKRVLYKMEDVEKAKQEQKTNKKIQKL